MDHEDTDQEAVDEQDLELDALIALVCDPRPPANYYTAKQIVTRSGENYETVRKRLQRLAEAGKIKRMMYKNEYYYKVINA